MTTMNRITAAAATAALVCFAGACGPEAQEEALAGGDLGAVSPTIPPDHCLAGITSYATSGPFGYSTRTVNTYVKMWIPNVPAGCKIPVVHYANGTGARCSSYATVLARLASHGFFGVCYESTNTGAGDQGIAAIQAALSTYPNLVDHRIGSTGHSQGGQAAFIVLQKAEQRWAAMAPVLAGLAVEPASGYGAQPSGGTWQSYYAAIRSPMFMFSGAGTDGLVSESWVRRAYTAMDDRTEAYFWAAYGARHVPPPNALTNQVAIPWFRWKLLGDQNACRAFKALANQSPWVQRAAQNAQPCL